MPIAISRLCWANEKGDTSYRQAGTVINDIYSLFSEDSFIAALSPCADSVISIFIRFLYLACLHYHFHYACLIIVITWRLPRACPYYAIINLSPDNKTRFGHISRWISFSFIISHLKCASSVDGCREYQLCPAITLESAALRRLQLILTEAFPVPIFDAPLIDEFSQLVLKHRIALSFHEEYVALIYHSEQCWIYFTTFENSAHAGAFIAIDFHHSWDISSAISRQKYSVATIFDSADFHTDNWPDSCDFSFVKYWRYRR